MFNAALHYIFALTSKLFKTSGCSVIHCFTFCLYIALYVIPFKVKKELYN